MTEDRARQARKAAERPEMRIVSRAGEELVSDALGVVDFHAWGCNDYMLVAVDSGPGSGAGAAAAAGQGDAVGAAGRSYVVLSPKDLVLVMPRDRRDHVSWLVERKRYEEALEEAEALEAELNGAATKAATLNGIHGENGVEKPTAAVKDESEDRDPLSASEIGQMFIDYLVGQGSSSSLVSDMLILIVDMGQMNTTGLRDCVPKCAGVTQRGGKAGYSRLPSEDSCRLSYLTSPLNPRRWTAWCMI